MKTLLTLTAALALSACAITETTHPDGSTSRTVESDAAQAAAYADLVRALREAEVAGEK